MSALIFQLGAPGLLRVGRATTRLGTASLAAAAKIRAKAMVHKGSPKAEERTLQKQQRALDKQFAKASAGAFPQGHASDTRAE